MSLSKQLTQPSVELRDGFLKLTSRHGLARLLEVPVAHLTHVLYKAGVDEYYRKWEIKKRTGGTRLICAPQGSLYFIQRKLCQVLNAVYMPKHGAHGFVLGRNVVSNAAPHVGRRYVFNIDIKEYFPSINFGRVRALFGAVPFRLNSEVATTLAKICCHENGLPIGAPTSPVVANLLSMRLDVELQGLAKRTGCWYTRYADDITFSTNRQTFPAPVGEWREETVHVGQDLRRILARNGFQPNESKTRLQPRSQRQSVTGIVVNERTNVDRRWMRNVRAMLHSWSVLGIAGAEAKFAQRDSKDRHSSRAPKFRQVLGGKLAYLSMVRGKDDLLVLRLRQQFHNLSHGKPMHENIDSSPVAKKVVVDLNPVRVLHLSDFHFREETAWDQDPLLKRMAETIANLPAPDLVVVTGDVAHSGRREEYDRAESWFRSQLIPAARSSAASLLFVPGNHDVDRKRVGGLVRAFQEEILALTNNASFDAKIAEVLARSTERDLVLSRLEEYCSFVRRLTEDIGMAHPWWSKSVHRNGVHLRVAGLCSPWLSCKDKEVGKLVLGLGQANEVFGESGDVNVALMHHPMNYFCEADNAAMQEVENWAHVILRGHLHTEKAVQTKSEGNQLVSIAAGSAYQGSHYENGFQFVELSATSKSVRVRPYRWNKASRRWQLSKDVFPGGTEGVGEFNFGKE